MLPSTHPFVLHAPLFIVMMIELACPLISCGQANAGEVGSHLIQTTTPAKKAHLKRVEVARKR